ncbi:hypothetical protein B0F90DRAFT_1921989 [Multifurca ochricompacta]|uniref:Uncharacterized protein n=1 Tax=Multifurca ochricompacta TaxID=376703 RepID=A0AAD4LTR5_9AGAM|nr:hypothetical protein B0F90DRAFT_1921989 [Multifurca ochricompacta]
MGIWFVANQEQGQSPYHPIADKMSNIVHDKDKPYQKHNHVGQPHRSHISVGGFPPGSGVNGEITGPTGVRVDVGILPQESEKQMISQMGHVIRKGVRDHMVQSHMVKDHMVKDHMAKGHMAKGHMARSHMTGRGSSTSQSCLVVWTGQIGRDNVRGSYGCQAQGQGQEQWPRHKPRQQGRVVYIQQCSSITTSRLGVNGSKGGQSYEQCHRNQGRVLGTQATGIKEGPRQQAKGIKEWSREGGDQGWCKNKAWCAGSGKE